MTTLTALVTGANRGIGFEVCRQLARLGYCVLLTSRDEIQGQASAASLRQTNAEIHYHPLDVTQKESLDRLRDFVLQQFGALHVLVNNAAVYLDDGFDILDVTPEVFRTTMDTNLYGPFMLCRAFIPLMLRQNYGRVVNVSSNAGQLRGLSPNTAVYRLSKVGLNTLTRILARRTKGTNVLVNAVNPGWVRTDMGGPRAPRSIEKGAETIVWLATLPEGGPNGGFFYDKKPIAW